MDLNIDYLVINNVRYIPEKKTIDVATETEPVLVYSRQDKVKERNREYYKKNRDKWKQYNENKKEKQKKLRTVIEFY